MSLGKLLYKFLDIEGNQEQVEKYIANQVTDALLLPEDNWASKLSAFYQRDMLGALQDKPCWLLPSTIVVVLALRCLVRR